MDFATKLRQLRTNSKLKQSDLAEKLHISQQAIAKWENGKSEPNITMIKEISKLFNCSIEELIDDHFEEYDQMAIREVHSPVMKNFEKMCAELDEKTLDRIHTILHSLRRLQNNNQIPIKDKQYLFACIAEIIGRIELYSDNGQSISLMDNADFSDYNYRFIKAEMDIIKDVIKIFSIDKINQEEQLVIPFYLTPVSAGTGTLLSDDVPTEWINVPKNDITISADYMTEVRGDSMIPKYYDGDRVLIKKSDSIREGEIGIFIVNNEAFVKKMGNGELISLNPEYDNIQLSEFDSVYCEGKVIGVLTNE